MATAEVEVREIGKTLDWAHDEVGLTYDQIGDILSVSERTLRRWRRMDNAPRLKQKEAIENLRELQHLLREVFPDEEAREAWLRSPSGLLRGRSPISLLRAGRVSRVVGALATLESGAFT
jgi:putative toxin-antitoxin system antitoxin component (TIGR02293 family)